MAKDNNLKDFLTDVADAIREKEGSTGLINPQEFSAKIRAIETGGGGESGGGGGVLAGAVNFRDYDGTILHSFSKDEFLALEALPELPTQAGLVCQEWNWSLEDAQAYVQEYGMLEIGATYITDDGKTRIYLNIEDTKRGLQSLRFNQSVTNGVEIDWGDGSATETMPSSGNKTATHTYAKKGKYIITLSVQDGCTLGLGHSSSGSCLVGLNDYAYQPKIKCLYKVELGKNVPSVDAYAFYYCIGLESITIPNNVKTIGNYSFNYCYLLKSAVFPNGVSSVGSAIFSYCNQLASICLPTTMPKMGTNMFNMNGRLERVTIPNQVKTLESSVFNYCYALKEVIVPKSVTSMANSIFAYCSNIEEIILPDSVTSVGNYTFNEMKALKRVKFPNICKIGEYVCKNCHSLTDLTMPNESTQLGRDSFYYCYNLREVVIPNGVTAITTYAFYGCYSLLSVTFPSSVTTIANYAFYRGYGLTKLDFRACKAIPTLENTGAFSNLPTDCKIIVPDDLYDDWKVASNWSSYASRVVKASEYTD